MSSRLARPLGFCFATASALVLVISCASSQDGVFDPGSTKDAGNDTSFGGSGGTATGGSSGTGATGGMGTGGSSGFSGSGATGGFGGGAGAGTGGSGFGGTGGTGTGGTGAGGSGGGGTCQDAFCPSTGVGTPCCVTPNGPCGTNTGMGCQSTPAGDF